MPDSRLRLPLLIAAFAVAQSFGWGMTFNLPAITGAAMAEALALPYAAIMAGPTIMLVVMALGALPFARLFEQLGARVVMTASVAIGALGLLVISIAAVPWSYFAGWLLVGLGGAGMLTTAIQIGIAELAGPKAKQAITAMLVFSGLSATICWPLVEALQAALGWRAATAIGAGLMFITGAPIYWFLLAKRPAGPRQRTASAAPPRLDWTAFGLLAFSTAANGFVTWGFSLTIITLFETRGLEHPIAVAVGSFIGVAAFSARFLNFIGGGRWSGLATALGASIALPLSFSLLLFLAGMPAAIGFVVVYGVSSGVMAVARSTLPLELFPPAAYTRASSALALPLNLSFAFAPPIFGAILAGPGSDVALWIATALSLAALLSLTLLVIRHRSQADAVTA